MCQDLPEHAEEYQDEMQDGDIIISATDGVFDNLFNHEIFKCVRDFKQMHGRLCTKEQADVMLSSLFNIQLIGIGSYHCDGSKRQVHR